MKDSKQPKIGIGVTTYLRPKHLKLFLDQVVANTSHFKMVVADDSKDRKGIAFRKNQCLEKLKDCDYIFLFDDDTFPISKGWVDFFVHAHKESGQHHFLYLTKQRNGIGDIHKTEAQCTFGPVKSYNSSNGCFMFLTKQVLEKVGKFGEYPNLYGYEHAGYTKRVFAAGLTPMGEYLCPAGAEKYLYCLDFDSWGEYNRTPWHYTSIPKEEMVGRVYDGSNYLQEDIKTIFKPLV